MKSELGQIILLFKILLLTWDHSVGGKDRGSEDSESCNINFIPDISVL